MLDDWYDEEDYAEIDPHYEDLAVLEAEFDEGYDEMLGWKCARCSHSYSLMDASCDGEDIACPRCGHIENGVDYE